MKSSQKCYTQKKLIFLLLFVVLMVICSEVLHSQTRYLEPELYYKNSINLKKSGMIVLGSWAGSNLFSGLGGNFVFENEQKYFFQMNEVWNLVNLGIATFGYLGESNSSLDLNSIAMVRELEKLDRFLLINAGLDLLYVGTGGYLLNRRLVKNRPQMIGYGHSVLLQG